MKKISVAALFALSVMMMPQYGLYGQSTDRQETLNKCISDLQQNPKDYALREKIIKIAQEMKPAPEVPKAAARSMARGTAAVKDARNVADFKDAVSEFEKAALAAPWFANAYYNLGISQDKAGMYAEAIGSLKLYLLAAPGASDAKSVENLIYEIEYRQEKAAKQSSPEAAAAKKQEEYRAWLAQIDGARYTRDDSNEHITVTSFYEVHGNQLTMGEYVQWCSEAGKQTDWQCTVLLGKGWWVNPQFSATIENREASWLVNRDFPAWGRTVATISEDGATLSLCVSRSGNDTTYVFRRSR